MKINKSLTKFPDEPKIIVETPQWIVVDKPSGWLTIPGRNSLSPILIHWVQKHVTNALTIHRLDLETSGVVLFAKTAENHRIANQWFEKRKIKKTYFCLAQGAPEWPIFRANIPIEGVESFTQFEVKERFQFAFLSKTTPLTGKRHQIRIHLAKKGFPILGDTKYGGKKEVGHIPKVIPVHRVMLHAAKLELPTGEIFQTPIPNDFSILLEWLRNNL